MERRKFNRIPNGILTADWHVREDTPTCYVEDFFDEDQWNSILAVKRLQRKFNCIVLHAGDLFHHWKPSPHLLTRLIKYLPDQFYTVYGQHDLPQHNLDLAIKSGICTLETAGLIKVLTGCHYGQIPSAPSFHYDDENMISRTILVWHHLTYMTPPYPGATGGNARGILRKYPFDLIVTGDNHESFYTDYQGRLLVNPGPITRQTAKQIDFKPRVYLWYADTNTVEPYYLPFTEGAVSREHIDKKDERDNRIAAYISKLDGSWQAELTFEDNLEAFKRTNIVRKPVMNIIYKSIEV